MSTYIRLDLEVTAGDALAFDPQLLGKEITVVTKAPTQGDRGVKVRAKLVAFNDIPEEEVGD